MSVQVNQELCTGCGVCVEACTVEAIHLVDQRAVINDALCTSVKRAVYTCPNGAIIAFTVPAHRMPDKALSASESRKFPLRPKPSYQERPSLSWSGITAQDQRWHFWGAKLLRDLVDILDECAGAQICRNQRRLALHHCQPLQRA